MSNPTPENVLAFWFDELGPRQWFSVDEALDRRIESRFGDCHAAAVRCELQPWRTGPRGRLAEIIVIDQFSRNLFRGRAEAFAGDPLALALAQEGIAAGVDADLTATEQAFFYMPYMHSESAYIHQQAMRLYDQPGLETNLDFERRHKAIIDRFGRYPHRNAALGRISTDEELAFLEQPGSSF